MLFTVAVRAGMAVCLAQAKDDAMVVVIVRSWTREDKLVTVALGNVSMEEPAAS